MNELMKKLKKNSTIKQCDILANSKLFNEKEFCSTSVPVLNIALSGKIDGGFSSGVYMWAGESRRFKCFSGDTKLIIYEKE